MASKRTGFSDRSALIFGDDATGGSWPFGDVPRRQPVRDLVGDPVAALVSAGAAMARVQQEVDQLWRDSLQADNRAMSVRLTRLSCGLC